MLEPPVWHCFKHGYERCGKAIKATKSERAEQQSKLEEWLSKSNHCAIGKVSQRDRPPHNNFATGKQPPPWEAKAPCVVSMVPPMPPTATGHGGPLATRPHELKWFTHVDPLLAEEHAINKHLQETPHISMTDAMQVMTRWHSMGRPFSDHYNDGHGVEVTPCSLWSISVQEEAKGLVQTMDDPPGTCWWMQWRRTRAEINQMKVRQWKCAKWESMSNEEKVCPLAPQLPLGLPVDH